MTIIVIMQLDAYLNPVRPEFLRKERLIFGFFIDFTPGFGDLKGLIEGLKGEDLNGQRLAVWERVLCFAFLSEIRGVFKGTKYLDETTDIVEGAIKGGENLVYISKNPEDVVQYVGITNNYVRRASEHLRERGIIIEPLINNLSRSDARAVEQVLIEYHGLTKHGGTLINKINSIANLILSILNQLRED